MIYKSSHSLQSQILSNIDAENALFLREARWQGGEGVFLPDHLGVNCKTGREIFKVEAGQRVSFVARPKAIAPCYIHRCTFEGKHFTSARIYYKDAWRNVMVLHTQNAQGQAMIDIMDITDPKKPHLLIRFEPSTLALDNISQAIIIKLPNGNLGLAFGGARNEVGFLKIILLEDPKKYFEFTTDAQDPLIQVSAIDLEGQGRASRLYGIDARGHVWAVPLQDSNVAKVERLTQVPLGFTSHPPLFIKHEGNEGLWIYLLGKDITGLDTVLKLQDKLQPGAEPTQAQVLKKGLFQGMWLRGGQLKLLTKSQGIAEAELLWDPKNQDEVLLVIDPECQVRMLSFSYLKEQAGHRTRISVRK